MRAVRDGKVAESIFIEGLRLCQEALLSGMTIEAAIYSDQLARKDRATELIHEIDNTAEKSASVSEKLLESISYTKTPQGIVVIAARPSLNEQDFSARQAANTLIVILHRINNPVNVGAIARTAEAAGATGLMTTAGTADPFSPKSLRGAMGSAFRLPIWTGVGYEHAINWCRRRQIQTACADVHAQKDYTEIDWSLPTAIVMGPESEGLSPEEIAMTDEAVRIPMKGQTESLNVAVAAGILLFEINRVRSV